MSDTLTALFAEQVARFPNNAAVIADDGVLTYRQLAARAGAVASVVPRDGGGSPVALLCRHGGTTIAAMLGVLLAGRAYVPLDPTFPARRLTYQLADSGAELVLTDADDHALATTLADEATRVVDIDPVLAQGSTMDVEVAPVRPADAAYLLYTSGSTGTPKGVWQNHRNVVFAARNHIRGCGITPQDRTSVLTSFGFDMAVTDTFSALLSGAAAVPIDIRSHGLATLADLLSERGVTLYHSTPTVYRYLVASLGTARRLPNIRVVLLGGEEVTARDVRSCRRHFGPHCVFVNGYGTTEVSFVAQHHIAASAPVKDGVVPIGRPLAGLEVVLLDAGGRPSPTAGEIMVRGKHVALGYHGLADDRFGTERGARTYRTGDLARWLPDGMLAFLGRADRQVKIRGHRVELGDVETHLADLPGVSQAAVIARRAGPMADLELIGYVVPRPGTEWDWAAVKANLRERLPDHLVPRAIVPLAELPRTETGKLDVRALPDPPAFQDADQVGEEPPVSDVIAKAWCEVLAVPEVGRDDHFFDLGGHSLLMALVQQRLDRTLGRRLPMATLFAYPTVSSLAAHLSGADRQQIGSAAAERAELRRQARIRRVGG